MKYESSFKSEADGLEISVMALIPDKKPYRAVVQLVHGMSEHKERYIPFMQYLAKLGYVVVIHDHRGHGKSVKIRMISALHTVGEHRRCFRISEQ